MVKITVKSKIKAKIRVTRVKEIKPKGGQSVKPGKPKNKAQNKKNENKKTKKTQPKTKKTQPKKKSK